MHPEDLVTLDIQPLGQCRLLESLQQSCRSDTVPTQPSAPAPLDLATIMQQLASQSISTPAPQQLPAASLQTPGEPQVSRVSKKHLDITDFVTLADEGTEQLLMAGEGGDQFVLKSGSRKPKFRDIFPMQWLGASLRIMWALIDKGDLSMPDIGQYLTYLEKLTDISPKYTWESILVYNRQYRIWQARESVQWGTDNVHLINAYAIPCPHLHVPRAKSRIGGPGVRTPPKAPATQVCKQYNLGDCTFVNCRYLHQCSASGCLGNHPFTQHPSQAPAPKNATQRD